jgi:hypothetical protein
MYATLIRAVLFGCWNQFLTSMKLKLKLKSPKFRDIKDLKKLKLKSDF